MKKTSWRTIAACIILLVELLTGLIELANALVQNSEGNWVMLASLAHSLCLALGFVRAGLRYAAGVVIVFLLVAGAHCLIQRRLRVLRDRREKLFIGLLDERF